jgi:hypothetical protein
MNLCPSGDGHALRRPTGLRRPSYRPAVSTHGRTTHPCQKCSFGNSRGWVAQAWGREARETSECNRQRLVGSSFTTPRIGTHKHTAGPSQIQGVCLVQRNKRPTPNGPALPTLHLRLRLAARAAPLEWPWGPFQAQRGTRGGWRRPAQAQAASRLFVSGGWPLARASCAASTTTRSAHSARSPFASA